MSVRSRLADPPVPAVKAFGGSVPPQIQAGEAASQMTPASPFSPGEPVGPYDGYSRTPRSRDYVTGYNIATRPRTHERVSFEVLKGLIDNYDVAQLCIRHRIASIRSLDWKLITADGYDGDITDAIPAGMEALKRPDRKTLFTPWLAKWLRDILSYDAGALERMRNRAGRAVGLRVVSGRTLAPLLDYWGDSPEPPAPAYVQFSQGLPFNWLTRDDIIYEPYDPQPDSIYGRAPLEDILLNANTDIRFQLYFLQRFTEGNIPQAFASAPETWSPDQIETFQELWDSFMLGDQSRKSQIRWIPGGSSFAWSNEKDFTDTFSLFLMRKTCAAYSVVPTDLGFTENANLASGESQADVQHRVGDLPLAHHVQDILSAFLQDDLGLPLKFAFDLGEEQDDRLNQAQADQIYIQNAVVGASEVREMRFGLPEPEGQMVPRYIFTPRGGPVPLSSLLAVAGPVDAQTSAPEPGAPLPHTAFEEVEGVIPNPPLVSPPLAEQEFGPSAIPPAPPPQPGAPVAKEGGTAGITAETGIYGYDGPGQDDEDGEKRCTAGEMTAAEDPEQAVVKEMAAYRRFTRARRKAGEWRDFRFGPAMDPVAAHRLNDAGRFAVRKAAGEVAVAGLAVQAADTGRVLMLQRALDPDDPAGGTWEFPGGHVEGSETPFAAAAREWSEETGTLLPFAPDGVYAVAFGNGSGWTSGIYEGFVYPVESEDCVSVRSGIQVTNPDDPDGDQCEAIAWWNPADLPGNPAIRPELAADMDAVMAALGCGEDELDDGEPVAKAGDAGPKAPAPSQQPVQQAWPGWDLDLQTTAYWVPVLIAALLGSVNPGGLAAGWAAEGAVSAATTKPERIRALTAQAGKWLRKQGAAFADAIADTVNGVRTDGFAIGAASAKALHDAAETSHLGSIAADMGGWTPGASSVARELIGELGGAGRLADLLKQSGVTIRSIDAGKLGDLARVLAEGAERGDSADVMTQAIRGLLSDPSRAEMIVATELARAANSAAMWQYRLHGTERVRLVTAEDGRVCGLCDAAEAAGPHDLGEGDEPPLHPLCFPAGVEVSGPRVLAATSRHYEGDLVTIVLASGNEIPVTPNHPVLTPRGWVAAGELHEGDNLLRARDAGAVAAAVSPDDHQVVARIEQVAGALAESGAVPATAVPVAAEDFHGDGSPGHDVHVVTASRYTVGDGNAECGESTSEVKLKRREMPAGLGFGDGGPLGFRGDPAAAGFVGSADHGIASRFVRLLPAQAHGVTASARGDVGVAEHPFHGPAADAVVLRERLDRLTTPEVFGEAGRRGVEPAVLEEPGFADSTVQRAEADTGNGRALADALAGLVEAERVIELRRVNWAGHVYNLETVGGWYIANGIIAHNCRCALVPA